jgi:hypothetical protein
MFAHSKGDTLMTVRPRASLAALVAGAPSPARVIGRRPGLGRNDVTAENERPGTGESDAR